MEWCLVSDGWSGLPFHSFRRRSNGFRINQWTHGFESRWSPDFFRLLLSNCLNWKIYCDDHTSLSSNTAVQIWIISYIFHNLCTGGSTYWSGFQGGPKTKSLLKWLLIQFNYSIWYYRKCNIDPLAYILPVVCVPLINKKRKRYQGIANVSNTSVFSFSLNLCFTSLD